jgi:hypothetical protein
MSNEAARAARNEALRRHRREVEHWKSRTTAWMSFCATILLVWAGVEIARYLLPQPEPQVWRTDRAPALQPYYVVTQGYVTKKGEWKSFDNGESITVTHWTTAQP